MAAALERNEVLVIIPAYNEESVIGEVVSSVCSRWNVLVVDDGSADETASRAARAGARVLRHCVNRGQGAALETGLTYARRRGYEVVVTFDADGQHSADDISSLLEPIRSGRADVVLGSRFMGSVRDMPRFRRVVLKGAILFTWAAAGVRLTDAHNGLRALSRQAYGRVRLRLDRMAYASELIDQILSTRLRIEEVPVSVTYTGYSLRKGQRNRDAIKVLLEYLLGRLLG